MGLHQVEARISLTQLARNIELTKARLGRVKLLFPVKADAYGHGAVAVARLAERTGLVDYLGVANLDEAVELRQAGIELPVLIMSASRPELAGELAAAGVTVTVSTPELAQALERASALRRQRTPVQIKVDSGMGRNGVLLEEAFEFIRQLQALSHLELEGVFTHFSVSYSTQPDDQEYTRGQIAGFNELLAELDRAGLLPPLRHIANSSGLIQYEPQVAAGYYNLVRPGILLYGHPEVRRPWTEPIRPILQMVSWIVCLKTLPAGRYIGYGRRYRTEGPRRIATLPVGYADGLSWLLERSGEVLLHGRRASIVGGISMDQITVDVSEIPEACMGDEVELIGDQLSALELSEKIGAHFTEVILTALSRRVVRVYSSAGKSEPSSVPC
ncbi:MAG TPA: alanine racemase [Candidatus Fraserbacteria bacterium]|nr:alanine racemase [Candidatus Fraserbacteria bacterium]